MRYRLIGVVIVLIGVWGCRPAQQPGSAPAGAPASVPTVEVQAVSTAAPTGASTTLPALRSGLAFTATIGPTCPGPQREGQVCTAPYEGEFVVTRADGSEVARFTTDADGRAVIDLPPGDYTVAAILTAARAKPRGNPVAVNVAAGLYVEATIELDTGMR